MLNRHGSKPSKNQRNLRETLNLFLTDYVFPADYADRCADFTDFCADTKIVSGFRRSLNSLWGTQMLRITQMTSGSEWMICTLNPKNC